MNICSCFHPAGIVSIPKKNGLKGILRKQTKYNKTSMQSTSLESNQEPEAGAPAYKKWDMSEMGLACEVIMDDFMKPLSKDIVHVHHIIIEPLQQDVVLIYNECSAQCFDDSFAREYGANAVQSLHQLRQPYQQQHPEMRDDDCDRSQSTEKVANTSTCTVSSTFLPRVISNGKTYSKGLRTQGSKKMGKNGTMGISQREKKQSTTIQRKRSNIGRV